jgi:DNA-cytosine methyltransferase
MAFVDKKANKVKEEEWKFVEENEERVARSFSFYYPWNVYKRTIPENPVDIYMTSPACQSFSMAGKRLGKNDPRGVLFFNSLEFIEKNKPKCFIFENVKGLLSDDDGHTFKEWIHYLGGKSVNGHPVINFGNSVPYHVYYKVLNAKEYGVPQNRERIFVVGFRDDEDKYFNWPDTEPLKKTLMDVLEHNVDEKYYLSDTMVKRLKIKQKDGRAVPFYQGEDKAANCLVATYYKTPTDGQYVDQDKVNVIGELDRIDRHEQANRIYDSDGLSPTLQARSESPMIMEIGALRGRNLQDINDRTSGIDTEQILEMNSFGVSNTLTTVQKDNVVVETKIIKNQRSEEGKLNRQINKSEFGVDTGSFQDQELVAADQEYSDTILANPNHTKEGLLLETKVIIHKRPDGEKEREIILSDQDYAPTICAKPAHSEGLVAEKYESDVIHHRIRKLTPRECFRLMDFPEDFDFSIVANSHSYKQAGNSIVRRVLAKMIDNFSFINQYKNQ